MSVMNENRLGTTLLTALVAFVLLLETSGHMHDVISSLAVTPDGSWLFVRSRYWLLRSQDGGDSWTPLRSPINLGKGQSIGRGSLAPNFVLSPDFENDKTLAFGMHLSTDAGNTWARQLNVTSEKWGGVEYESCNRSPDRSISFSPNFAIDKTIYTVARRRSNTKIAVLLYSKDLGKTFGIVKKTNGGSRLAIQSPSRCPVLTATTDAIYLQVAGKDGRTTIFIPKPSNPKIWRPMFKGSQDIDIQSVAVDHPTAATAAGNTVLLLIDGISQTLYRTDAYSGRSLGSSALTAVTLPSPASQNLGDHLLIYAYVHKGEGSNTSMVVLRSACPYRNLAILGVPTTTCAAVDQQKAMGQKRPTSFPEEDRDYILLSRDEGATWTKQTVKDWFKLDGGGTSRSFGDVEFTHVVGVPGTPRMFLGTFTGLYRSDDHGESWLELDTIHNDIIGLNVANVSDDRFQLSVCTYDNSCWSGVADLSPLRDGSKSRLPDELMAQVAHDLSSSAAYNTIAFSNGIGFHAAMSTKDTGLIVRSTDGFTGNSTSVASMPKLPWDASKPHAIEYSPDFKNDGTLFIGGLGYGICRSTDRGLTFQRVFAPETLDIPNAQVIQLVLSPKFATDGVLYAHVTDGKHKKFNQVFASDDSGLTWAAIGAGSPAGNMLSFAVTVDHNPKRFSEYALVGVHEDGSVVVSRRNKNQQFGKWKSLRFGSPGPGKWFKTALPGYARGLGFCRDGILGAPDGKLYMSMLAGGVAHGRLKGDRFATAKNSGLAQRFRFGGQNSLVEDFRKSFSNMIAASPDNKNDGVLFGAFHYEIYVSLDHGATWKNVYALPSNKPRFSGAL